MVKSGAERREGETRAGGEHRGWAGECGEGQGTKRALDTSLQCTEKWVEVKERQPGEGELARLQSTGISPRQVRRACKPVGCSHRTLLAGLGKAKGAAVLRREQ